MAKIEIIAVGQMKRGPLLDLCNEYIKRLQWPVKIIEIKSDNDFAKHLEKGSACLIAMDERGKSLSSAQFAQKIEKLRTDGHDTFRFLIGGADGLPEPVRNRTDVILAFGAQTWPHMLARMMLLEQIYRTQQILSGHPYHRE